MTSTVALRGKQAAKALVEEHGYDAALVFVQEFKPREKRPRISWGKSKISRQRRIWQNNQELLHMRLVAYLKDKGRKNLGQLGEGQLKGKYLQTGLVTHCPSLGELEKALGVTDSAIRKARTKAQELGYLEYDRETRTYILDPDEWDYS